MSQGTVLAQNDYLKRFLFCILITGKQKYSSIFRKRFNSPLLLQSTSQFVNHKSVKALTAIFRIAEEVFQTEKLHLLSTQNSLDHSYNTT